MFNPKKIFLIFSVIQILSLFACSEKTNTDSNDSPQTSSSEKSTYKPEPLVKCEGIRPTTDLIADVISGRHLLYELPNDKSSAVVNIKASKVFGTTQYHGIDTSVRVKIQCIQGEWVFVQLTMPEWLTHAKGWTKRIYLQPFNPPTGEPTKANDSQINFENIATKGYTSIGLTKADLAWHALNTYGFNCSEVVMKKEITNEKDYLIECSNGKILHVYPRNGRHPNITE